ncbi:MAG: hypothetical protein ACD_71C00126G0003 [uncultured bacterium (gcode 4)]|uniref:Uncharacterized protein n=1 Tax=uncultured bacterium (gcode 4) TaxID=1234023 RepID=K1ZJ71_9BACT|nr:MAG: hypothetical protein ACD_71C00126G0003 [uncultured bacterium (gcode 4)]
MRKYTKMWIIWISWILILILWVLIWKYGYNYFRYGMIVSTEELENRKIDEYNFWELEKVKNLLKWWNKDLYKFNTLKEFNEKYKANIKPIKNCYFLSNTEKFFGKADYILLFEIFSEKYKNIYKHEYYVYPEIKYNQIEWSLCWGHGWVCTADIIFWEYIETISNPCRD